MPKKRSKPEIVSEMTGIIVKHLETMPAKEQKQRLEAFRELLATEP